MYLKHDAELREVLGDLKPAVAQGVDEKAIAALLPGQTSTRDATTILKWAKLLAAIDTQGRAYYDGVIALAETIRNNAAGQNIPLPSEHLMLCVVGNLIDEPPKGWRGPSVGKLAGMRFALGSEFFRNLGWNGFKPDRHIIRLLDCWVPGLVEEQRSTADRLLPLTGRNTAELREMMSYSLAGIAISPTTNYSRTDNLIWLLGHYVETKRKGSMPGDTRYLLR